MKYFLIIFITVFLCFSLYKTLSKTKPQCQKEVTCFDKTFIEEKKISSLIKELETNGGKYNCKIIPSKYMKSEVFTYTSVEELTDLNQKILGESSKNSKVQIDCKLYENDKEDPKKKSDSCKLFTGYLLYEFKMDNQPIYKIQIDYLNSKGKDISQRVDCIKDSLYQYK